MIHDDLETALANNPKKKGVELYNVLALAGWSFWIWSRSKRDAIGLVATERGGFDARKYHAGAQVESDEAPPNIQGELYDG